MDFLSKRPFFSLLPPRFFGKDARSFAHHVTHCFLIRTALRANGHAPAHRALSEFEILAFTHKSLIQCMLRVKEMPFFSFTGEGNRGETFTHKSLFPSCLQSYGEEVKAKNEKQRTRALRVRVGAEVGSWCTVEKGFPVVETSLQMSDEPILRPVHTLAVQSNAYFCSCH